MDDAEAQIARFVGEFAPGMQSAIRDCRRRMQLRLPGATQLVYDNYNFLVIGYGPDDRPSDSIFSLACQKSGVSLCFLQRGPDLPDPTGLLRGSGKVVRSVGLAEPGDLDRTDVVALIEAALGLARVPMDASARPQVLVRSVSAKRRPRR